MSIHLADEDTESARQHWDAAYGGAAPEARSWFQAEPRESLRLIQATGLDSRARVLDVGGGTSRLVDRLLDAGYTCPGVLDISPVAIAEARQRLGARASEVEWFVSDVNGFVSPHTWDVWHDRALFHFLTDPASRREYCAVLRRSLSPGGQVIMATFGPEGPDRCSGLPVRRYDGAALRAELGPHFRVAETVSEAHRTPRGTVQQYLYCRLIHGETAISALDGALEKRG